MCRLPWCALPHLLLLGCLSAPVAQAAAPVPSEPSARPPLPLSIEDQRPDWERHSKDCTIEFIALEDCAAPPWSLLTDPIQQATSSWADPPCRATLELRSFRVIVRQSGGGWGNWNPGPLKGSFPAHGDAKAAAFFGVVVLTVGAVVVTAAVVTGTVGGLVGYRRSRLGPPYIIGNEYPTGITSEVKGDLVLSWSDGRTQATEVAGVVNGGPRDQNATSYMGDEIDALIKSAIQELGRDWLAKNNLRPVNP